MAEVKYMRRQPGGYSCWGIADYSCDKFFPFGDRESSQQTLDKGDWIDYASWPLHDNVDNVDPDEVIFTPLPTLPESLRNVRWNISDPPPVGYNVTYHASTSPFKSMRSLEEVLMFKINGIVNTDNIVFTREVGLKTMWDTFHLCCKKCHTREELHHQALLVTKTDSIMLDNLANIVIEFSRKHDDCDKTKEETSGRMFREEGE